VFPKPADIDGPQHPSECDTGDPLPPSYSSMTLFRGQKEIVISHQGASYRLRITRTGGLILNK
jgi:hemin uptake protein HemP